MPPFRENAGYSRSKNEVLKVVRSSVIGKSPQGESVTLDDYYHWNPGDTNVWALHHAVKKLVDAYKYGHVNAAGKIPSVAEAKKELADLFSELHGMHSRQRGELIAANKIGNAVDAIDHAIVTMVNRQAKQRGGVA
ncbi:MAG: hypothetical protein ACOYNL_01655 [Rickettsiales bacterium]